MLTLASVVYFGILLIVIGGVQILQTFKCSGWKSIALHGLIGLLYLGAGIMIVSRPLLASLTLTWALGFMLIVVGVMRIVVGVQHRGTSGWGGGLVGGIITLLLGLLILARWPSSALWVIGFFLAIELIVNGWHLRFSSRWPRAGPTGPCRHEVRLRQVTSPRLSCRHGESQALGALGADRRLCAARARRPRP